ncbi:hypothetical protein HPB49_024073 [Dermacentor silvarum]|uniref:Uncharacterized protein n=1 Tax=Dermacentor silvarum TaxID=543639 RepID=A0ACB8D918_DERSI|nr:hypothetical protein HPB49_024073 [Dermacentor silvarum]
MICPAGKVRSVVYYPIYADGGVRLISGGGLWWPARYKRRSPPQGLSRQRVPCTATREDRDDEVPISYSHSSDHGPAPSADWPDPGPDGSSDFYEDQFRLGNANSLRPAAPYDADRQRALLEGTFHRAPVQQLSLTCPTNDPAPCSTLESCSATINGHLLKNLIDRSTLSTVKNDVPVKVSKIAINQLERLPSDNGKLVFQCTALSMRKTPRHPSRLVPSSRTPSRATPSASLAGPRAARAATSTSYPSP